MVNVSTYANLSLGVGFAGFVSSSPFVRGALGVPNGLAVLAVVFASVLLLIWSLFLLSWFKRSIGIGFTPTVKVGVGAVIGGCAALVAVALLPFIWVKVVLAWVGVYLLFVAITSLAALTFKTHSSSKPDRIRVRREEFLKKVDKLTKEKVDTALVSLVSIEDNFHSLTTTFSGFTSNPLLFIDGSSNADSLASDLVKARDLLESASTPQEADSAGRFISNLELNYQSVVESTKFPVGLTARQKKLLLDVSGVSDRLEESASTRMGAARKLSKLSALGFSFPDYFVLNNGNHLVPSWKKQIKLEGFGN